MISDLWEVTKVYLTYFLPASILAGIVGTVIISFSGGSLEGLAVLIIGFMM